MPVYIPSGTDLISEERLEQSAEQEIELLFGKLKKGEMQGRWDIINRIQQNFIPVVEKLLVQLEKEKRSAENLIYRKLQETQILIELFKKINSKEIKKELKELKALLRRYYFIEEAERKAEIRLGKGKKIPGFFVEKAKGPMRRYAGIIGCRINVQKRKNEELADIEKIKELIQELQLKFSTEASKELEQRLIRTIRLLKQDFEDLLKLEIDADIEEALKLQKIRTLILMLQRLNIKEPIPKLRELESKCRIWVEQDQRNDVQLEILTRKLEEQATNTLENKKISGPVSFKIVVNPQDPDFRDWYNNCYATKYGFDNSPDGADQTLEDMQSEMTKEEWFLLVAKAGNTVIGGIYFGYYILTEVKGWKGVVGYSGYIGTRRGFQEKGIAKQLVELSEKYLHSIAKQKGYVLMMVVRFVESMVYMRKFYKYSSLLKKKKFDEVEELKKLNESRAHYLHGIGAKRAKLGPMVSWVIGEHHEFNDHDQYINLFNKWKGKGYIPKELWLEFLRSIVINFEKKDPLKDTANNRKYYLRIAKGLAKVDKIELEELNI